MTMQIDVSQLTFCSISGEEIHAVDLSAEVLHADHGISEENIKDLLLQEMDKIEEGFFIHTVDEAPFECLNALRGPVSGHPAVTDDEVSYEFRGDRPYLDRMCGYDPERTRQVQMIGIKEDAVRFKVFTVYGGPLAPQHPDDPTNADPDSARDFWSVHALCK